MSSANDLFAEGKLDEAIAAAVEVVKSKPADEPARGLLAALLCFRGDLERADKQLEALGNVNPDSALGVSAGRNLIRSATARREVFTAGRIPDFIGEPPENVQLSLKALAAFREGDVAGALELTQAAEEARPAVSGRRGGSAFDDLRDLDDVIGGVLEVMTLHGTYYWIPMDRVTEMEVRPPKRPFDLLWASARISVSDGPDGEVYLPTIYHGAGELSDELALGRATNWNGDGERAPVRGEGLKMILVGDEALPILELGDIETDERDG